METFLMAAFSIDFSHSFLIKLTIGCDMTKRYSL